jgi:hypothetical protein
LVIFSVLVYVLHQDKSGNPVHVGQSRSDVWGHISWSNEWIVHTLRLSASASHFSAYFFLQENTYIHTCINNYSIKLKVTQPGSLRSNEEITGKQFEWGQHLSCARN